MRTILSLAAFSAIILVSCESKKEGGAAVESPKGSGYTLDSSANTELVKKLNNAFPAGDSATVYACYSDTAKVHDNLNTMSIKDNFREFQALVKQGLHFKLDRFDALFEVVNYKPTAEGYTNYVVAWVNLVLQKGNKSVTVIMNQAFAIKDGKVVEEWDTYDTAGMMGLMK